MSSISVKCIFAAMYLYTKTVLIFFLAFLLQVQSSHAQLKKSYRIALKVENCKKPEVLMGKYYGNKNYAIDTAFVDSSGNAIVEGPYLDEGLYFFAFGKNKLLDFIVDKDQDFEIYADCNDLEYNTRIKGSAQNSRFYDFIRANRSDIRLSDSLTELAKSSLPEDSTKMNEEIQQVSRRIKQRSQKQVKKYPKELFSKIILINTDPEIPEDIRLLDKDNSKTNQFRYFKSHFWDGVDFTDHRLLNTPYYYRRLERYFNDLTLTQSNEMIRSVDSVMKHASVHTRFFTFTFDYISERFHKPKHMGDDAVFVHLVENHLNSGTEGWVDSTNVYRFRARAKEMSLSLIGKEAPNLKLLDINGKSVQLSKLKAQTTVLLFYNSGCGNCKAKIPLYKEVLDTCDVRNLKVLAICTEGSIKEWKKFIAAKAIQSWHNVHAGAEGNGFRQKYQVYSVPMIYVLDKKKKILAKQLNPEQLDYFLRERLD